MGVGDLVLCFDAYYFCCINEITVWLLEWFMYAFLEKDLFSMEISPLSLELRNSFW